MQDYNIFQDYQEEFKGEALTWESKLMLVGSVITSMYSQLASDGIILSTASSKLMTACNSDACCCKSVQWEADNSSTENWHYIKKKSY